MLLITRLPLPFFASPRKCALQNVVRFRNVLSQGIDLAVDEATCKRDDDKKDLLSRIGRRLAKARSLPPEKL